MKLYINHLRLIFLFLVWVLLIQGCSTTQKMKEENARNYLSSPTQQTTVVDSTYKISTGDEIEILVWEQPNFNTETTVSSMGTIAVPLLGEIQASGRTHAELKRDLIDRLSEYIKDDINLTLSVRNTDNLQVAVFGMVSSPANYPVVDQTSIFKILSMAGGPSEEANIRNIRIYRQGSNPNYTTLDLTEYLENGQISDAGYVNPGDIVYVPQKQNAVREMSGFLRDIVLLFGIFRIVN